MRTDGDSDNTASSGDASSSDADSTTSSQKNSNLSAANSSNHTSGSGRASGSDHDATGSNMANSDDAASSGDASSSDADSTTSSEKDRDLGRRTAETLMGEMRFLGKLVETQDNDNLIDGIDRPEFQQIDNNAAAKSMSETEFVTNIAGLTYCVSDGRVEQAGLFDVDHAHAFSHIKRKQKALLTHLNDSENADFRTGFLSANGISKYFDVDPTGIVKGKKRFYKLCYNDIDNLLLLCHSCNMHKNSKESLEWFGEKEPFLGKRFVDAVDKAGGLHDGIIMQKVMKTEADTPTVKIGDIDCVLHAEIPEKEEVVGIGKFVRKWFAEEHPGYSKSIVEAYKNIWLELKGIFEARLSEETDKSSNAEQHCDKIASTVAEMIQVIDQRYGITGPKSSMDSTLGSGSQSSSSSDSTSDVGTRIDLIRERITRVFEEVHNIKRFFKKMRAAGADSLDPEIKKANVYALLENIGFYELMPSEQKQALEDAQGKIKTAISNLTPGTKLTLDVATGILRAAVYKHSKQKLMDDVQAAEAKASELAAQLAAAQQALIAIGGGTHTSASNNHPVQSALTFSSSVQDEPGTAPTSLGADNRHQLSDSDSEPPPPKRPRT